MANINHDAVLSAAWMLVRRAKEAGPAADRSDTSGLLADQATEDLQSGPGYPKEAVKKLIAAYLNTPAHITSPFHSW